MIGTKLAYDEITSHLGSGGMGNVYQATARSAIAIAESEESNRRREMRIGPDSSIS